MKEYSVYIVRCSDGSYYTGITNDVERRVAEHNNGMNSKCYTYRRRPVHLVYRADFREVWEAIAWETKVKKWGRAKKEALVRGEYEKLPFIACMKGDWSLAYAVRTARFRVMVSLSNHRHRNI